MCQTCEDTLRDLFESTNDDVTPEAQIEEMRRTLDEYEDQVKGLSEVLIVLLLRTPEGEIEMTREELIKVREGFFAIASGPTERDTFAVKAIAPPAEVIELLNMLSKEG